MSTGQRSRRRADWFSVVCVLATLLVLVFIGSALVAILAGGVSHLKDAATSEEVLFSLRMSLGTSTVSTCVCLLLAMPTAFALTHLDLPGKRIVEVLVELTLSLPYILLGFALLIVFSSPVGKALKLSLIHI